MIFRKGRFITSQTKILSFLSKYVNRFFWLPMATSSHGSTPVMKSSTTQLRSTTWTQFAVWITQKQHHNGFIKQSNVMQRTCVHRKQEAEKVSSVRNSRGRLFDMCCRNASCWWWFRWGRLHLGAIWWSWPCLNWQMMEKIMLDATKAPWRSLSQHYFQRTAVESVAARLYKNRHMFYIHTYMFVRNIEEMWSYIRCSYVC